jgi:anaerobic selenocysteine-containing dehydrogenase
MIDTTKGVRTLDRRGFLKGSALFAAVLGAAVAVPAFGQEPQKPAEDKPADKTEQKPTPAKKPLLDKEGREYRVCDMCGGNMYKQDNTWTCEQCGYSYQE